MIAQFHELWVQPIVNDLPRMASTDVTFSQLEEGTVPKANLEMIGMDEVAE